MKFTYLKSAVFFFVLIWSFQLSAQVGVEYIWGGPNSTGTEYDNSTFNGGLNDWTTEGLESANQDSAANAVWRWVENGSMSGAYWDESSSLHSPSVMNGSVGFNSISLDDGGNGSAPAPQKGVLTSPSIDCSGESMVSVLFYESYRNFMSRATLEVSNDDGNTWVQYAISMNDSIEGNRSTPNDAWTYVNISPTAANQSDVHIRFVWDGSYYFWIIDDVSLIRSPQNDLAIVDFVLPVSAYSQPLLTGVGCDSAEFSCTIRNVAKVTRTDVTVFVKVNDAVGEIYVDSVNLAEIAGDAEDFDIHFGSQWILNSIEGDYTIAYSITDHKQDFNLTDNEDGRGFVISEKTFSMGPGIGTYLYPTVVNSKFAVGSFYSTCDFDYTSDNLEVAVDSFGFAVKKNEELTGAIVDARVLRVSDAFPYAPNEWELKGHAKFVFSSENEDTTMVWVTQFEDDDGTNVDVVLDPNSRYLSLISEKTNKGLAFAYSPDLHYYKNGIILLDGLVYGGWSGFGGNPQIVLKLKFVVDSKMPKLASHVITVMPNPVEDQLNLKLDFENATDIAYALGTMTGSLLQTGQWKNALNETKTLDVSKLPNGQYLVRIQTEDGIATKMFVVAR